MTLKLTVPGMWGHIDEAQFERLCDMAKRIAIEEGGGNAFLFQRKLFVHFDVGWDIVRELQDQGVLSSSADRKLTYPLNRTVGNAKA